MNIKLYIKDGCPWCIQLEAFLTTNNIKYNRIDVTSDEKFFEEMKLISGQEKAPVIIIDEDIIADTDADQVKAHLISKGIVFENEAPSLKGVCNL